MRRKIIAICLLIASIIVGCGQIEKINENYIEIKTSTAVLWDLTTLDTDGIVDMNLESYESLCIQATNGLNGLFTECIIEDDIMTIKINETQKNVLLNVLNKKVENIPNYVLEKSTACTDFKYSNGIVDFYINPTEEDVTDFLFDFRYTLRFAWIYQLQKSLLSNETQGVCVRIINNQSEYVMNQCIYNYEIGNNSMSFTPYIIHRSFYDSYDETTTVRAVFTGIYGENKKYAQFQATDEYYFEKNEIFYIALSSINEEIQLQEQQIYLVLFDTESGMCTVSPENLSSGLCIQEEHLIKVSEVK